MCQLIVLQRLLKAKAYKKQISPFQAIRMVLSSSQPTYKNMNDELAC